ncbi:MAG: hypothetical protein ACD_42C00199G0003 [uncultured bacterium]|nr:MAG: hypothetical protein ACD_42C00199G0003 [uncultured bacterium]
MRNNKQPTFFNRFTPLAEKSNHEITKLARDAERNSANRFHSQRSQIAALKNVASNVAEQPVITIFAPTC